MVYCGTNFFLFLNDMDINLYEEKINKVCEVAH